MLIATPVWAGNVVQGGFSYTPVTNTFTTDTTGKDRALTDEVIWTPASGNRIILMGVSYSAGGGASFLVEQGSTAVIPKSHLSTSGTVVIGNGTPIWKGGADEALSLTTTNILTHSITMWGFESTR